ncbi:MULTISPECIES: heme exporter protein CcmD [Parasedimentitalea]|nr:MULTISPECIES: heme exporter protein CcmD [Zongyanglinia]
MMPDLGKYAETVLSAYVASIALLVLLVVISVVRGRRVRAEMDKVEKRVMGNG